MKAAQLLALLIGLASAGCGKAATPAAGEMPSAMRGCWEHDQPPSEEHPDGVYQVIWVTADTLVSKARGVRRREGSVELVDRLTANSIEGRISAMEDGHRVTLATALELDPDTGELLLREGDAGSYSFRRCTKAR